MKKQHLQAALFIVLILAPTISLFFFLTWKPANSKITYYTYRVVNMYPHDENAFTQGLAYENGSLYESTGRYGSSTLRRVNLETGEILQHYTLPSRYFGEGITICQGKIIQLTWTERKGFVYDKDSFELRREFGYPLEGWGITYDGNQLIMSNGSSTLTFLDPATFEEIGQIEVYDTAAVTGINELEYVNGKIYANIWKEEKIAIINPQAGQVEGWIDLSGIQDPKNLRAGDVLNGIAYDEERNRLFVTGKRWPRLFEIQLIPLG